MIGAGRSTKFAPMMLVDSASLPMIWRLAREAQAEAAPIQPVGQHPGTEHASKGAQEGQRGVEPGLDEVEMPIGHEVGGKPGQDERGRGAPFAPTGAVSTTPRPSVIEA